MRILKSYLLLIAIFALSSTIAVADRIGTSLPVKIGVGSAVNTNVIFDIGSGSTNPMIQSTSAGVLKLSNDETNFVTVPSANDTMCVLATSQTLTNKIISGSSNTLTVLAASQLSGLAPTANGGTNQGTWTAKSIPYMSSSTQFSEDNTNFAWDGTNHRLGVGTNGPVTVLDVEAGTATVSAGKFVTTGNTSSPVVDIQGNQGTGNAGSNNGLHLQIDNSSSNRYLIQGQAGDTPATKFEVDGNGAVTIGGNTTSDANLGTIDSVSNAQFYRGHFSYVWNGSGFSASQTTTINYMKWDRLVCLDLNGIQALGAASAANVITGSSAVPTNLQPSGTLVWPADVLNNGVDQVGAFYLSAGVIRWYANINESTAYGNGVNIGWERQSFCYIAAQ